MTSPEVILWQSLRKGGLADMRFRRQHAVGPYILDFYSAVARLAVEIDGMGHDGPNQSQHDARRDAWLSEQQIRVLRFSARDVLRDKSLADVLSTILAALAPSTAFGGPPPPFHGGG